MFKNRFKRATATFLGINLFFTGCLPSSILAPADDTTESVVASENVLELLDLNGGVALRMSPRELVPQTFQNLDGLMAGSTPTFLRTLRNTADSLIARRPAGDRSADLLSQVVDALAMPSNQGYLNRVARLPVSVLRERLGTPSANGRQREIATYYVDGSPRLRLTHEVLASNPSPNTVHLANFG